MPTNDYFALPVLGHPILFRVLDPLGATVV